MNAEQTVKKFFELLKEADLADKQAQIFKAIKDKEAERKFALKCTAALQKALELTQLTWRQTAGKTAINKIAGVILETKPSKIKLHLFEKISEVCYIYRVSTGGGDYMVKVVQESEPYKPDTNGKWGVNITSIKKVWN